MNDDLTKDAADATQPTLAADGWTIVEHTPPESLGHAETLFTIGNGSLGVRGTFEEGAPGESRATFMHRVWDDMPVNVTELVNLPAWLGFDVWVGGRRLRLDEGQLSQYERTLNLRDGLLTRSFTWRADASAPAVRFVFERFIDLTAPHRSYVRMSAEALDADAPLRVRLPLDAHVENTGLVHLDVESQAADADSTELLVSTRSTRTRVGVACRVSLDAPAGSARAKGTDADGTPASEHELNLPAGERATITKYVAIVPDLDAPYPLATARAEAAAASALGWDALLAAHDAAWAAVWAGCDIEITGDDEAQVAVRYNMFQLLIAAPRFTERASIGAKTLSGFGYRHHAFWDTETFMLPMFTYTAPQLARNMLLYRWHGLDSARAKARDNGFSGAQFPWESAADGSEVTPTWVTHYADRTRLVRIWTGDIEIHITADIAYAVLEYWRVSGDTAFMREHGAEIVLDGATFYATAATRGDDGRYHFRNVIGPDEYHEHVDDNAYTNYLAAWHLRTAAELLDWLREDDPAKASELTASLGLDAAMLARWADVGSNLYLPQDPATGVMEQFHGYFSLTDADPDLMRDPARTTSIQQLYGIEETNLTQVLKQPDVLMLAYLLPDLFTPEQLAANYAYYDPRTDHEHGSSLGPSVSAVMACRAGDPQRGYEHFMRAARADLFDVRHNASDGIHGASAGGLWQAIVFGFAGLKVTGDGYTTDPALPAGWRRLVFTFSHGGRRTRVAIEP